MKTSMLHKKWFSPFTTLIFASILIGLIGCAGSPANNPMLVKAQEDYLQAHNDASIVKLAPVELKEAEEALLKSTNLWKAKADKSKVNHYAYLADRKILIARETSLLNAAEEEISSGETERQRIMLDVRRADALRSENRANEALGDAKRERLAATEARAGAESARLIAEEALVEANESRAKAELLEKKVRELQARPTDRGLVLTLGDVLFDLEKSTLKTGGKQTVNQLADFLNEYPERNVLIEGFTDSQGSEDFNLKLSSERAENVKSVLMSKGVQSNRIRIYGYGTKFPVADNKTKDGRRQNRRVEVVISDQDGVIKDRVGSK